MRRMKIQKQIISKDKNNLVVIKNGFRNLSKVFGFKNMFMWICPYWGSPKPYKNCEKES